MLPDERSGGAGVVEMDVGEEQVADVAELDSALGEPRLERRNAARGAAVEEGQAHGRVQQVRTDRAGRTPVEQVDRLALQQFVT